MLLLEMMVHAIQPNCSTARNAIGQLVHQLRSIAPWCTFVGSNGQFVIMTDTSLPCVLRNSYVVQSWPLHKHRVHTLQAGCAYQFVSAWNAGLRSGDTLGTTLRLVMHSPP